MKNLLYTLNLCLAIILTSGSSFGQKNKQKDELSYKEQQRLERLYIDAEKARVLGEYDQAIKMLEQCLHIDPTNAAIHYTLASLYMRFQEAGVAEEHAREASKTDPTNYYYRQLYAEVLKASKKYKEAATEFESVIKDFPKHYEAYIDLALVQILQKKYSEAIDTYTRLEGVVGPNEELKLKKQYLYLQTGDVNKAAEEIEQLIEMQPDNFRYYLLLAEIYSINAMDDKAGKAYKRASERFPKRPEVHLSLADYYHKKHEINKSLDHLMIGISSPDVDIDTKVKSLLSYFPDVEKDPSLIQKLIQVGDTLVAKNPGEAKAYTLVGDIYLNAGLRKKARNAFKSAVELDPAHFAIWNELLSLEADMELFDTLILHCTEALEYFPNQPILYYFSGYAHSRQKDYQLALSDYERGANMTVDNDLLLLQFYLGIGETAHEIKEYDKSDQGFENALKIDTNNTIALNNYSYYLSLRNDKLDVAKKMSARSNKLEPNQPTYLDTYAWILYQMKDYEEARVYMEKALQYGGEKSGVILEHMGDILFQLNRQDDAIQYWKRASETGEGTELLEKKLKEGKLYE